MKEGDQEKAAVDRFILDRIDSVPHLEALLLLWRDRPHCWSVETLARRLWVSPDVARIILYDLARDYLITAVAETLEYCYRPDPEKDRLIGTLDDIYRQETIRISNMIHSKPSSAVREFARAFRLKKEER